MSMAKESLFRFLPPLRSTSRGSYFRFIHNLRSALYDETIFTMQQFDVIRETEIKVISPCPPRTRVFIERITTLAKLILEQYFWSLICLQIVRLSS